MARKDEIQFTWDKTGMATEILKFKNNKQYQIKILKIHGNYRAYLLEDNYDVSLENTTNDGFRKIVDVSKPVEDQVLEWATYILSRKIGRCDNCKETKVINKLAKYDLEKKEFNGYKKLCKKCRSSIYDIIYKKIEDARKKEDRKFIAKLDKNPPEIIGGFKKRIDAFKVLKNLENPDRIELEEGFEYAKGILKAADGTFYPAFFTICVPDGGEHWDTDFITSNLDVNIPQHIAMKYIGKKEDEIFPYDYETLSHIEGDFHQKTWFGTTFQKTVRHHFVNQITLSRPTQWDSVEETIKVEVRTYFSIQHLLSSAFLCKQLIEFETNLSTDSSDEQLINHRSFVVSVIMSSVSFLEATINELFMDSAENPNGNIKDLNKSSVKLFAKMWKKGIPRTASYSIIEKYQIALTLANKKEFDLGTSLLQNVTILIKLRNALVHYEPESVVTKSLLEGTAIKQQKLEQQLKGKFKINPYTGVDNPFFPDKCLSLGCALWALKSTVDFTDSFFLELGIIPTYQKIKFKITDILKHSH
jgi:hypothetical protein